MAKKRRTAMRSTKAAKRRPTAKRKRKAKPVKQDNTAPVVTNFDPTPYLIAARQREFAAAVQSTIGGVDPPVALRAGAGLAVDKPDIGSPSLTAVSAVPIEGKLEVSENADRLEAEGIVFPPPTSVTPTVYPDSPDGKVIVHNNVTINIGSVEFKTFNTKMDALVKQLQVGRSNQISGEVCAQLLSEIMAGREILKGPKPSRDLIKLLLVKPLEFLMKAAAGAIIGDLAGQALDALLKIIM